MLSGYLSVYCVYIGYIGCALSLINLLYSYSMMLKLYSLQLYRLPIALTTNYILHTVLETTITNNYR